MASDYRIIVGGTTLYLSNSTGAPVAGGAATAAATTPWMVRLTDWTPTSAPPRTIWSGGPPFRNGADPLYQAYETVTETIPLVLSGGTHDTLAARLQQLKQLANVALFGVPALLQVQPSGATSPVYFEIYSASAQERNAPNAKGVGEGAIVINVDLTITRSPHGGSASLATLINGATFTNRVTGANPNTQSLGALTGDLVYEGQPLNIQITPAGIGTRILYAASVASVASVNLTAATGTTTSTGGIALGASAATISSVRAARGLKLRILVRVDTLTNPTKMQLRARLIATGAGATDVLIDLPWSRALGSNTTAQIVDLGGWAPDFVRLPIIPSAQISVEIWMRSIDGTSVTATASTFDALLYYDFGVTSSFDVSSAGSLYLLGAQNLSGAYLPLNPPRAVFMDATPAPTQRVTFRGTIPRAWSGSSLYLAWYVASTGLATATDTSSVTVTHAPLYRSLRGNN